MARLLLTMVLSISLVGCTTMRAVESPRHATRYELEAGDKIVLTTLATQIYELEVRSVSDDAIVGRDDQGKLWKVPVDQVAYLEVEEFSVGRTAGLSGGVALVIFSALVVGGAYAFAKGWEDAFSGGN